MATRYFIFFCFFIFVSDIFGQAYIYRIDPDLLLDSFPSAALAVSLRKLDRDYFGRCLTIQRDNGDTSNIFFKNNYLDTISLKNFCGTGAGDSCRVRVWFDQSGNARNFRQETAANQPLIMVNGAINYDNGEVSIIFDGSNDWMEIPESTSAFNFVHNGNDATFFVINRFGNTNNPNAAYIVLDNMAANVNNVGFNIFYSDISPSDNNFISRVVAFGNNIARMDETNKITANQINLLYEKIDANNATAANRIRGAVNGSADFGNNTFSVSPTSSNSSFNLTLGATANSRILPLLGAFQEMILYNSDKSSDKLSIETNINRFYSIY